MLAALLFVAVFSANGALHAYRDSKIASEKRNTEAKELAELQERQYHLSAELNALDTDRGVEAAIREKFGMVKDGEEVVVLPTGAGEQNGQAKGTFWQKIRSWFGKN